MCRTKHPETVLVGLTNRFFLNSKISTKESRVSFFIGGIKSKRQDTKPDLLPLTSEKNRQ